jgi:hypothetical protein
MLPLERTLGGGRCLIECAKRRLEPQNRGRSRSLLGNSVQVAGSYTRKHLGGMRMCHRLTMRAEVVVRLLASFGTDFDGAVIDGYQTVALGGLERVQGITGGHTADLDRELKVEPIAKDR